MPIKKCRFGFSCAAMMMTPGLTAEDCPNRDTCGILHELTPDEQVELVRVREIEREQWETETQRRRVEWERVQETIRVTQRQAATMMLMSRGCSQSPRELGVTDAISAVSSRLEQLRSAIAQLEESYIAPPDCEAHQYNVKRPRGIYFYNKLTAGSFIFEPSERTEKVRVLHLSHDDDERNLVARSGVDKRNKLLRLAGQLRHMEQTLASVLAELQE
jgi:hypothetical protein